MINGIVEQMLAQAQKNAEQFKTNPLSRDARMGYVRGVNDMAALVAACANATDEYRRQNDHGPAVDKIFKGYSDSLRHILKAAESLIPPGYEY